MTDELIIGAAAIAEHHARLIWTDSERRAEWSVGLLDVTPEIDAHLCAFEAADHTPLKVLRRSEGPRSRRILG